MEISALAQELRERQYNFGEAPRELIDRLSDMDIIDSYITCSCCGVKQIDDIELLELVIAESHNADCFFSKCDKFSQLHRQIDSE